MTSQAHPGEWLAAPWVLRGIAAMVAACALAAPFAWILGRSKSTVLPAPPPAESTDNRPVMVVIPAGDFVMGSPSTEADRDDDETQHSVRLTHPFMIARTEVTQGQYAAVVGENPAKFKDCGPECPVEQVSWSDAVKYCNQLSEKEKLRPCYVVSGEDVSTEKECEGYRLPTEAEWEYAARGGRAGEVFVGASEPKDVCYFDNVRDERVVAKNTDWGNFPCNDHVDETAPVARFLPNGFGLYDMGGNVAEWCWDWYDKDYYARGDAADPVGPSTGEARVIRGGSWGWGPRIARVAFRGGDQPSWSDVIVGFRVARSLPPSVLPSYPLPGVPSPAATLASPAPGGPGEAKPPGPPGAGDAAAR